jgi:aminoglycoside phosphotransferase (APT) family kinase protein
MHADEVAIDVALAARLVTAQFPELAVLPISAVRSTGTVNAIFRLGDRLCVRMPRVARWARDLETECMWLPKLAPHLSLRIPEPVGRGVPTSDYPFAWAIYDWIEGEPYADDLVDDERQAALDLARFVGELRRVEPTEDAPAGGREPLGELDADTRDAIAASAGEIDVTAAMDAWEASLEAPTWGGTPTWVHADLLRPNLLVDGGRLRAVIDFGGAGVGDPAIDVIPAWSVFGSFGRRTFRDALEVDDGTYLRARGFALHQAAMIIPYYRETNPGFVELAARTVGEVLADAALEAG